MVALAAHLAQVGELPVGEPLRIGLRTIQQAGNLRGRQQVWYSVSIAASCSPRTSELPLGIITAASQRQHGERSSERHADAGIPVRAGCKAMRP